MQRPSTAYRILFGLLTLVYVLGLFVPLMDNDAAHHANIALNMYLTGDYIRLIDAGRPYLDKPHFLFWTAAFSYKLFGITAFAYRLPSFLFTLLGTWSTYKLGQTLYGKQTGLLAALMTASCFSIILANNDVRMEAILTGAGMLATWQGIVWLKKQKLKNAILLALALAIGFSTKGWSGTLAPVSALIAYILATKRYHLLAHPHLILALLSFCVFIAPVLYCYYQQFDVHPELVIREKTGRSGIRFILWDQNFERFHGEAFGGSGKHNTFMFFHTFLWAFAPWSIFAIIAVTKGQRGLKSGWWFTITPILVMAALMTFSGYRLPHYLNVILPYCGLLTATYLQGFQTLNKVLLTTQVVICILALVAIIMLNTWAFPLFNKMVIAGLLLIIILGAWIISRFNSYQWLLLSIVCTVVVFFLLNTNFYPQLLSYQGGITLARTTANKVNPKFVYYWPGANSASYSFYSKSTRKNFVDSVLLQSSPVWVLTETHVFGEFQQRGYKQLEMLAAKDYSTDKLKAKFIIPDTRSSTLDSLFLIRLK